VWPSLTLYNYYITYIYICHSLPFSVYQDRTCNSQAKSLGTFRFGPWCLRKILRIPYTRHTTNDTVRSITACSPVSGWVNSLWLRFFGHLARTAPDEDHHHVIAAALRPPADWKRPVGRPRTTWLRTIDDDLQSLNFRVHTAWRKARAETFGNAPLRSPPMKKKK